MRDHSEARPTTSATPPAVPPADPATPPAGFPLGSATTIAELEHDPHPRLALLREREPVSWIPELGGWTVTRRDLAMRVMRDPVTFTVDDPRFSTAQVVGPSMLSLDGPAHKRHREPFTDPFRVRDVHTRFNEFVERESGRLVDAIKPRGSAELRREVAGPLAVAVVAESLGLLGADPKEVLTWYDAMVGAVSDLTVGEPADPAAGAAFAQLEASVGATVAARNEGSVLVEAARDGRLALPEVASNAAVLMFGGIETTEGMITNAVLHLLRDPAQLALVRADPELVDAAVEESLRLEPAAAVVDRYATADVELGGARIRRGDLVSVSIAGANRDPAVFTDPDRFDLRRDNARLQLAFAHGPHFCLGAHLARLETTVCIRHLLDRLPDLHLDPSAPAEARGLVFRKPQELRVRWTA
ncbi:cytochrome P450 [Streptomyces pseudovenezuelae]|uniref:Cytochrome P450 n=1 Tax=Streptomyces pseudovenezuelae TaxID=67350 RepID=A0ABT6L938_9ACTN|nr:cytochrome P450 [Streptomyces pseudovenezuelae]MDH6212835.1 cytochrome P450 [Streptomyces pseudovenezuelae]